MSDNVYPDGRKQFNLAFAKAQSQVEGAAKNNTNPAFRSKYADLGAVWDACREALTDNGFGILQFPDYDPETKAVCVETIITHSGGFERSFKTRIPVSKHDAQGAGSAITYARRYSLMAAVGIAPEDDDGNAAAEGAQSPQQTAKKAATASKNEASRALYTELQADISSADSADALKAWVTQRGKEIESLPDDWRNHLRSEYADKMNDLKFGPEEKPDAA